MVDIKRLRRHGRQRSSDSGPCQASCACSSPLRVSWLRSEYSQAPTGMQNSPSLSSIISADNTGPQVRLELHYELRTCSRRMKQLLTVLSFGLQVTGSRMVGTSIYLSGYIHCDRERVDALCCNQWCSNRVVVSSFKRFDACEVTLRLALGHDYFW